MMRGASPMYRIIFVDDEQRVLDGLRRLLRPQRREWEMVFAKSGAEALEKIAAENFDVIVSDMRMPEMDGFALLTRIREQWPHMIRIILTGHTEMEAVLKIIPVAHQVLHKPCEVTDLKSAIERSFRLKSYLSNDELLRIIGGIDSLPILPEVYDELTRQLADENTSFHALGDTIEKDAGLSAKVLQIVNSALFGLPHKVSNISHAIHMLGINTVKNLVMAVSLYPDGASSYSAAKLSLAHERQHALYVGKTAASLLKDKELADTAQTAGILHDIGKLVLALYYKKEYGTLIDKAKQGERELYELEQDHFGLTHAEAGAYLLGIWGLPYAVVEAVALHHKPELIDHEYFPAGTAVFLANQLAHVAEKSHSDTALEERIARIVSTTELQACFEKDVFRLESHKSLQALCTKA